MSATWNHPLHSFSGVTYEPHLTATLVIRSPRYYGHFFSAQENSHTLFFLLKNPVKAVTH